MTYLVYKKYMFEKQALVEKLIGEACNGAQQQVVIYYHDTDVIQALMEPFISKSVIQYIAIYDQQGQLIGSRLKADEIALPSFSQSRTNFSSVEIALIE